MDGALVARRLASCDRIFRLLAWGFGPILRVPATPSGEPDAHAIRRSPQ